MGAKGATRSNSKESGASSGGRGGGAAGGAKKPARRAVTARVGAADAVAGGGGYAYAESLAYLCSQPERALKGVGPKKGQQLAKLGTPTE